MKQAATIISVAFLVWAFAAAFRIPSRDLTWTVPTYLAAQIFFALIAWMGLQRGQSTDPSYLKYFGIAFLAVIVTAAMCVYELLSELPSFLAAWVVIASIAVSSAVGLVAYWRLDKAYEGKVPASLLVIAALGSALLACGCATLISLFTGLRPAHFVSALSLGFLWLLLGGFFLSCSVGVIRKYTTWRLRSYRP